MTTPYPWWWSKKKKWSAKQHILAALVGALVAIAVVAGTSVSLAPAHIFFSFANATTSTVQAPVGDGGNTTLYNGFYNFTLVTNNTSWHTKAHFATLSAQIWFSNNGYIVAEDVNTTAALPGWQGPRNFTNVEVYAEYGQYDKKEDHGPAPPPHGEQGRQSPPGQGEAGSAGSNSSTNDQLNDDDDDEDAEKATRQDCRVVVEAKVWFKHVYGLVPTVPYTIRVNCFHVNFSNTTKPAVQCTH
ncbi:hypothetical protein BS78_10G013500 [Paspalum vaginatum]|nr:hypothetical protein BS78_10G013500 [Paspalum vaginatum]